MKGLICAGGDGDAARGADARHQQAPAAGRALADGLLPARSCCSGSGVHEVLLVTGKQHAGDFIDLLGDGRVRARSVGRAALRARPHLQGAGRAGRDRAGRRDGTRLRPRREARSSASATTSSRTPRPRRSPPGRTARSSSSTEVDDPVSFGVVAYGEDGRVADIVEKAGVVDTRYDAPPSRDAVVGLYCYPPDVFEIIDSLAPVERAASSRSPTSTARTPRGASSRCCRVEGWWHDGGKHWGDLADVGRLIEQTGVNK